jgi:hypothetical protein
MVAAFTAPLVYNRTMTALLDLGLHALRSAYCAGTLDVRQTIDEVLKRIAQAGDDKVWISRVPDATLRAEAAKLDARRGDIEQLPLYGVPFAVKDNIDVLGLATTAACPAFAYQPPSSSARPTSISSPPAWWACARPTACRATPSMRRSFQAARAPAQPSPSRRGW